MRCSASQRCAGLLLRSILGDTRKHGRGQLPRSTDRFTPHSNEGAPVTSLIRPASPGQRATSLLRRSPLLGVRLAALSRNEEFETHVFEKKKITHRDPRFCRYHPPSLAPEILRGGRSSCWCAIPSTCFLAHRFFGLCFAFVSFLFFDLVALREGVRRNILDSIALMHL